MTPTKYKAGRRITGIGIVVGNKYNKDRVVCIHAHNDGRKYQYMSGDCNYDFPEVAMTKYDSSALRDFDGESNTENIIKYSKEDVQYYPSFTWNSISYLNDLNYRYKESNWYVPSIGELKMLYDNKTIIIDRLREIFADKSPSLLQVMNSKLISSTQYNDNTMYGFDMSCGYVLNNFDKSDNYVIGISFKSV